MDAATLRPLVGGKVKDVATYGGQLSAVFHQYALIAERIPSGFEGATNILDATVATLNQISSLFKDEAEFLKNGTSKGLFGLEGITYVQILVTECAKTLVKVIPIVEDACLPRKEFQAKTKRNKKELAKHGASEIIISELNLDEGAFLQKVETTKWSLATDQIEDCMERLYDLQLHLLLVFQVVTMGALSRDSSSSKIDVKSIVTYHDRIIRTASLVGIDVPKTSKALLKKQRYNSSSDSDSLSSDSDSDASSIPSIKRKETDPSIAFRGPQRSPLPTAPPTMVPGIPACPSAGPPAPIPTWDAKPPSYLESHKSAVHRSPASANRSTLLGTASPSTTVKSQSQIPAFPDEKKESKSESGNETQIMKPAVHEPHLFNSKSNTFRFKLKSIFSNKESLAAEMRQALCTADSHLLAFVIQRHDIRQVPHSAFHSLEVTHMKTILSQLNDNTWYQNFTTLNQSEHEALHRVLYPWKDGRVHEREMVALKTVKNEKKLVAWVALLKELLNKHPFPPMSGGRVLLAIVREKLVDGKPILPPHRAQNHPPPPPMLAPIVPAIRPPPLLCGSGKTTIQDLNSPPPPSPPPMLPIHRGPPPPPSAASLASPPRSVPPLPGQRPPPPQPLRAPMTENDAALALTAYNEYTIRQATAVGPFPQSWRRACVTQESTERTSVLQRVQQFQRSGGSVIETKLRVTPDQSGQINRLMDEIRFAERDNIRFEWSWVEISLHSATGEITNFIPKKEEEGQCHAANADSSPAAAATLIHLIAKRAARPHLSQLGIYNNLMRGTDPRSGPARPVVPDPPRAGGPARVPPIMLAKAGKRAGRYESSDSDSDSDSSGYSSDSSVGQVRRRLKRYRVKKNRKAGRGKRSSNDSDSDSGSETEADDVIKVRVEMKRGDDVVQKLLDLWSFQDEDGIEGKGKSPA